MEELKKYIAPLAEPISFSAVRALCNWEDPYGVELVGVSGDDGGIHLPDDDFEDDDQIVLPEDPI